MTGTDAGPLAAMDDRGHEHVGFYRDERTGLRCLVAIHDTRGCGGPLRRVPDA